MYPSGLRTSLPERLSWLGTISGGDEDIEQHALQLDPDLRRFGVVPEIVQLVWVGGHVVQLAAAVPRCRRWTMLHDQLVVAGAEHGHEDRRIVGMAAVQVFAERPTARFRVFITASQRQQACSCL